MRLFLIGVVLFTTAVASGQMKVPTALQQQLDGTSKLYEQQKIAEAYWQQEQARLAPDDSAARKQIQRQRKFFNRYFYWAEMNMGANNELANIPEMQRLADLQEKKALAKQQLVQNNANWQPLGPANVDDGVGRVNRLAFHPTNANIIYAGASHGGLWRSTNGGNSWSCLNGFMPSLGVSGIVINEQNPNIIYVLTGDGDAASGGFVSSRGYLAPCDGVYKSTDGGETWFRTALFPFDGSAYSGGYAGFNLVADPNDPNTLLAATTRGLFRTTNGGNSWSACLFPSLGGSNVWIWDVAYRPGSSGRVYCAARDANGAGRILISPDSGQTFFFPPSFTPALNGAETAGRIRLATTPANRNLVFFVAGPVYSNTRYHGVWVSQDNGGTFQRNNNTPNILGDNNDTDQSTYDLAIAVSPTDVNTVLVGGLVVFRSTNAGVTFSRVVDYWTDLNNSDYIHPDVHDLQYNPIDGRLWAATDGGVSVSTDNGSNWQRKFNGMDIGQFYNYHPSNDDNRRWGGTQDCGILEQQSGTTFSKFAGGDGFDVLTDKAPAGNNDDNYWTVNDKVYTDGIITLNITPPGNTQFFGNLAMCPSNEDIIYVGYDTLWVSYNRGDDWESIFNYVGDVNVAAGTWAVAVCPSNPGRLYSAGRSAGKGFIYQIDNADNENTIVGRAINTNGILGESVFADAVARVTDMKANPQNSDQLYISFGGYLSGKKVYRTTNGGVTWTNLSANLPNLPVFSLLLDGNQLYAGTSTGVWYRNLTTDTVWTPFYSGLPRVPVTSLHKTISLNDGNLYVEAATFGRSLWRSPVFAPCTGNINISQELQGQQFWQGSSITATNLITGGFGTQVYYKAADEVRLQPGFHVQGGNQWHAYIGPCNTGLLPQAGSSPGAPQPARVQKKPAKPPSRKQ
jgi:photosystem II stability/assembly factor-like uncharacterized protein